jgi:hypothetical protein
MVLMDILDYRAALDTCFRLTKPEGAFVCTLSHPCFEESDADYLANGYIAVKDYFDEYAIPQRWGPRFHRPLSDYFAALIQRGGNIRAVIEPRLDSSLAQHPDDRERNCHVPGFIAIHAVKALT